MEDSAHLLIYYQHCSASFVYTVKNQWCRAIGTKACMQMSTYRVPFRINTYADRGYL